MVDVNNADFKRYVEFLTNGQYNDPAHFDHTTITVNLDGLTNNINQYNCAVTALKTWAAVTGLKFFQVYGQDKGDITFGNTDTGAYTMPNIDPNDPSRIVNALINVEQGWDGGAPVGQNQWQTGYYGLQTFIHEIGHALGLNHGGPYNATDGVELTYAKDAIFAIDTNQYSIMSYFSQENNPTNGADFAYLIAPMIADIKAINDFYGRLAVNQGNTTYGKGETFLNGWTDLGLHADSTYCINDTQGHDLWDLSDLSIGSRIDLRSGFFSDINGHHGNVSIAIGTVIEDVKGTAGGDTIIGNDADNTLYGLGGNDTLDGGAGNDRLYGGLGNDTYVLGAGSDNVSDSGGNDTITSTITRSLLTYTGIENLTLAGTANIYGTGNSANNTIIGNAGNNVLHGGYGNDTLSGGKGRDWLYGDGGNDVLSGGDGADNFVFNTALNKAGNVDRITDFDVVQDLIDLGRSIFTRFAKGTLHAGDFISIHHGGHLGSSSHIVYDVDTGSLSYRSTTGTGTYAGIEFATLTKHLALTYKDFVVI